MAARKSDLAKNFAKVTVSGGYAAGATVITLLAGHGAKLSSGIFDLVWWDATNYGDPTDDPNVEIVSVASGGVAGDIVTVTRAAQGTAATTKNTTNSTYKMAAAFFAKSIPIEVIKDVDGTPVNNSTVLVSDGDLTFNIGANEVWKFEADLFWTTGVGAGSANLKFDLAGPAAPTLVKIGSTVGGFPGSDVVASAFASGLLSQANATHASGNCVKMFGSIINGANAGACTVQIAQWGAVAENTQLKAGSSIRAWRVA